MTGRAGDPRYEIDFGRHKTSMYMDQFVDMVEAAGDTNDFYMIARITGRSRPATCGSC